LKKVGLWLLELRKGRPGNGLDWAGIGRWTVTHSTRSPVLRCGHLIQRPQLKH